MPRRTEEETNAAGAQAFKGALVGAAKVHDPPALYPQLPATHLFYKLLPNLGSTNTVTFSVGPHCWWSRRHRLFCFSYLSRVDCTVQSVCSCAV